MSSNSIPLGCPDSTLSRDDLFRALFCAQAVYEDVAGAEVLLRETQRGNPSVKFQKIHMSVEDKISDGQKFLVAHAEDAIFIAFRGTATRKDMASDLRIDNHHQFGGSFHAGFSKRANDFLHVRDETLASNPVWELIYWSEKRIVFCGHSLGGAVAHMVLLLILLEGTGYTTSWLLKTFNENEHIKWRFINIVNQSDPVPRLLHDIQNTVKEITRDFEEWIPHRQPASWRTTGALIGQCIDAYDESSAVKFVTVAALGNPWGDKKIRYIQHCVNDESEKMQKKLGEVKLGTVDMQFHDIASYRSVMAATSLIDGPKIRSSVAEPQDEVNLVVSTPAPTITSARIKYAQGSRRTITITGTNLLFLRELVSLNGKEPWQTFERGDDKLVILEPSKSAAETALTLVVIVKTAFGQADQVVEEVPSLLAEQTTTSVSKSHSKIVECMVLKGRFGVMPSDDHLERLDKIIQCAPKHQSEMLSTTMKQRISEGDGSSRKIERANNMVQAVTSFLTDPTVVPYEETIGRITRILLYGTAARLEPIMPRTSAALTRHLIARKVAQSAMLAKSGASQRHQVLDYANMLWVACGVASEWSTSHSTLNVQECSDVTLLEQELQKQVQSSEEFLDLIKTVNDFDLCKTSPNIESMFLKHADPVTQMTFLKKIKIVVDTRSLFKEVVMETQFWGILGAEDVGKSTFIKKALQRFENTENLPKCGTDNHTTDVTLHKLNSIWLVDFPGGNGLGAYGGKWEQFAELPGSCVLLLDFNNDIKAEQLEMYEKMKKRLDTGHIKVVFNKVDQKFSARDFRENKVTADYFNKQRENTDQKLKCGKENIYYVCLDPDPEEEKFPKLKEVGILGFEELFDELRISVQ
ncbi:unnamed protein product [Sphagnum troendelagicum]|uniref:Fungal lipase-like domain-containing protein n=1 Tax=Sphagnum troendelagicum TaxID=128251 RepID=A0ABP0TR63_9BRYO